jgi:preprotein translocase subunit YajC
MFASPAFAQAAGGAAPAGSGFLMQFAPLLLIFVIFYFLLIRPQSKRMKEHRNKLDLLKKGDTVVTAGGIIAKVIKVDETEAEIEIAAGTKVRVVKATITDFAPAGSAKPAND